MIEIQQNNLIYPNERFDSLWESNRLQDNQDDWVVSITRAAKVSKDSKDIDILCYDPFYLEQAWNDLTIVTKEHLELIEKELEAQENPAGKEKSGTKKEFFDELKLISEMLNKDDS